MYVTELSLNETQLLQVTVLLQYFKHLLHNCRASFARNKLQFFKITADRPLKYWPESVKGVLVELIMFDD